MIYIGEHADGNIAVTDCVTGERLLIPRECSIDIDQNGHWVVHPDGTRQTIDNWIVSQLPKPKLGV